MHLYSETAMEELRNVSKAAKKYYSEQNEKSYGITGSTFRTYRNTGISPSSVFKNWVKDYSLQNLAELKSISSRQQFLELHDEFASSLSEFGIRSAPES